MTYNPNPRWTEETRKLRQQPIYFIAIEGFPKHFSTHKIRAESAETLPLMRIPRGATQEIFPLEGKSSVGAISVPLLDKDGEISAFLATESVDAPLPTLINREVTLYGGYAQLNEADFAEIFKGQISGWELWKDAEGVDLHIVDLKRATLEDVFLHSTKAEPTVVKGNPINIWFAVMTGDFQNPQFAVKVSGAEPTGLDVSSSLIDAEHLRRERDDWLFGWEKEFVFTEKIRAKRFFEEELFKLLGYPVVRPDGRLSCRLYHPAHPALSKPALSADSIVGVAKARPLFDKHINRIEIYGDYDHLNDAYELLYFWEDVSDQDATREVKTFKFESKGLRKNLDGVRNAAFAASRIRQRFLKPLIELEVQTFFTKRAYEAGEVADVSHPHLPNLETGERGWRDVPCEITKANPDFGEGTMKFTLLATNLGRRYRVIGHNDLPDYDLQTAEERARFASVSTDEEKFSNGDKAHQII